MRSLPADLFRKRSKLPSVAQASGSRERQRRPGTRAQGDRLRIRDARARGYRSARNRPGDPSRSSRGAPGYMHCPACRRSYIFRRDQYWRSRRGSGSSPVCRRIVRLSRPKAGTLPAPPREICRSGSAASLAFVHSPLARRPLLRVR